MPLINKIKIFLNLKKLKSLLILKLTFKFFKEFIIFVTFIKLINLNNLKNDISLKKIIFNVNENIYNFINFYIKINNKEIYYFFVKFINYIMQF